MIFLSDYDMLLTEHLVQGVDVWINTPRRPWEACGTSGMKVLVNGGINLSELDGWWAEAYTPEVGWALGDGQEHGDDPAWDAAEADALYDLLEREVIPEFYTRDESGIPTAWVKRMRESMAQLTPRFSASRAVREYTEQHYLPAAAAYRERAANKGAVGRQVVDWQHAVDRKWGSLRFGDLRVETNADHHVFEVEVFLNDLDPNAVRVELYADGINGGDPVRLEMKCARTAAGRIARLRLSRNRTRDTSSERLHGASDTSALRGGGSVGIRSNPMATIVKTSERELHDYVSEVSERADVRAGSPLPLGTLESGGGVNFAIFSRHASRVRLELFDHPEDAAPARVIDLDSARNRTGDVWHVWVKGIGPGQLYAYRVDGPYEPERRTSFQFQQASSRSLRDRDFAAAPVGFCIGTWIRPVGAGTRLGSLEAGQFQLDAEMRICQRALRLAWRPAAPASVVEDRHLRNACSRLYHSSQVRRGASRNLPGADGKNSLSQDAGGDRCGTDARAGVQ